MADTNCSPRPNSSKMACYTVRLFFFSFFCEVANYEVVYWLIRLRILSKLFKFFHWKKEKKSIKMSFVHSFSIQPMLCSLLKLLHRDGFSCFSSNLEKYSLYKIKFRLPSCHLFCVDLFFYLFFKVVWLFNSNSFCIFQIFYL